MIKPVLLWSCLMTGSGINPKEDPNYCVDLWNSRKKLLEAKGVELKVLVPKRKLRKPGLFRVLDVLQVENPDLLLESPGEREEGKTNEYDIRIDWPRDNFQIFGDQVHTPRGEYWFTLNLLHNLMQLPNLKIINSRLGEGGFNLRTSKFCCFSNMPKTRGDLERIAKQGYQVYQLPWLPHSGITEKDQNHHLDTDINCAQTPAGNILLVVNEKYYNLFKDRVNYLRRQIDAKLYVVTNQFEIANRAVNFTELPNGEVIADDKNTDILSFLKRNVGDNRVIPIETFEDECNSHPGSGGLRCRTNLVYSEN